MRIERVAITHPDAARLVEEVQAEYVERYGGRDDTPLEPGYFDPPQGAFFVGYVDAAPAVSGAWRFRPVPPDVPGARAIELKRMYVVPFARGRGLARLMLAHLEATGRAAGADVVVLETGERQPEAIALYASAGYTPVPGFGFYRDSPISRCFAKSLVPDGPVVAT